MFFPQYLRLPFVQHHFQGKSLLKENPSPPLETTKSKLLIMLFLLREKPA
jgi:hypothetical protein